MLSLWTGGVIILTVNELFSGIGAFRKALINLKIPHKIVGISEIDKWAIKSYNAIYGETRNYGDITKVEKLDYADMWTYGFPCQDISIAGKQAGLIAGGTRSGLLYEIQRLLEVSREQNELPKYLILENVKHLVSVKFKSAFEGWLEYLDNIGYNTYWKVLNAKDYGIPQNRERLFAVSIRKDIDRGFEFSEKIPLSIRFSDLLEENPDPKYFITNRTFQSIKDHDERQRVKGNHFFSDIRKRNDWDIYNTLTTVPNRGAGVGGVCR